MRVIDHFFYAGLYLPAWSCFTDCPCSWDFGPYGTPVYWRFDYTADEVLLFLWRNLLEELHWAVNFTMCSVKPKSIFRCLNGRWQRKGGVVADTQEPLSHVGPQVAFHILPKAPQSCDVYYDAKLAWRVAIPTHCICSLRVCGRMSY